jgi:hypothetical protein
MPSPSDPRPGIAAPAASSLSGREFFLTALAREALLDQVAVRVGHEVNAENGRPALVLLLIAGPR